VPGAYADRVKETTTTAGSGTITLAGAVAAYQAFSAAFPTGTTRVDYLLIDGNAWEVGDGTYNSAGTTLARENVYASSNSNSLLTLSGGIVVVICDLPAQALADVSLVECILMNLLNR
jgi:hypothetical protein